MSRAVGASRLAGSDGAWDTLIDGVGFDVEVVLGLEHDHRRFFRIQSVAAVVATVLTTVGAVYGTQLAFESFLLALLVGAGAALVTWNLIRLLNAGGGYPIHLPVAGIERWRPPAVGAVVLAVLGVMLGQPLVLLAVAPFTRGATGIIGSSAAVWQHPVAAGAVTLLFVGLLSSLQWLRQVFIPAVRAYERARWIAGRQIVDDEYALAQAAIANALTGYETFSGELKVHFADPPYNTRPMLFGIDPTRLTHGGLKFVPEEADEVQAIEPAAPEAKEPAQRPAPAQELDPPPPPADDEAQALPLFPPDDGRPLEGVSYLDVGRLAARRARVYDDEVVPFVMALTGRSSSDVRLTLKRAPDEMPMHRVFPEWIKLSTVLLHNAGFAREYGLARILAVIVARPVEEVERRLAAAHPERRLSGVFAPELAKRLLGKDVPQG